MAINMQRKEANMTRTGLAVTDRQVPTEKHESQDSKSKLSPAGPALRLARSLFRRRRQAQQKVRAAAEATRSAHSGRLVAKRAAKMPVCAAVLIFLSNQLGQCRVRPARAPTREQGDEDFVA